MCSATRTRCTLAPASGRTSTRARAATRRPLKVARAHSLGLRQQSCFLPLPPLLFPRSPKAVIVQRSRTRLDFYWMSCTTPSSAAGTAEPRSSLSRVSRSCCRRCGRSHLSLPLPRCCSPHRRAALHFLQASCHPCSNRDSNTPSPHHTFTHAAMRSRRPTRMTHHCPSPVRPLQRRTCLPRWQGQHPLQ
jgi:hypothetical protein